MSIVKILSQHLYKIIATLVFFIIENIMFILHPFLVGKAIDGLLESNITPLMTMLGFYMGSVLIATLRRMFDTRIFAQVHMSLAKNIFHKNDQTNKIRKVAHIELTDQIIETFNDELPMFLESVIQIIGAMIVLWTFGGMYFAGAVSILFLMVIVYTLVSHKLYARNKKMNNNYERYIEAAHENNPNHFKHYFRKMYYHKIRLSDIEAWIYSVLYFGTAGLLILVLVLETGKVGTTAGTIFAVVSYVFRFEEAVSQLPWLYQKMIGTKEVIDRINS